MAAPSIQHMVIFNLKVEVGSEQADQFLTKSKAVLEIIPGVHHFQAFRQVSSKNDYDYGFSMEFENQAAYDAYNTHPAHVDYVENVWKNEVVRFQEIDFTAV
ncbi:Stress responsive A/B Barrel Domain [Paenibacillus sp. 1_12]|uniref:Dabb family protein n=1 Tax=Paenibacillus sp. 1_12 TaxID=1566278 RepID=UPI0008E05B3C|nr:Dabb family protein [Paenibacillus sp. 1_12]SFL52953.1 Stress responsive A/B Barrel Domain [Paenibacillus sp. 1_12]